MSRRKVCILSLSTIHQDGRVLRQIDHAARGYDVTVVGWGHLDRPREWVRMLPVERYFFAPGQRAFQALLMAGGQMSTKLWERWYWRKPDHRRALNLLLEHPCDLIHVNEVIALPIGLEAATQTGARVLFDAHEFSSVQHISRLWWRLLAAPYNHYLVRTYASRADLMTTVAPGLAARYRNEYSLNPHVIFNAPDYQPSLFRGVNPDRIRMIHHGVAMRDRRLDRLIEIVAAADQRYTLDFMLIDSANYLDTLRQKADALAPGRVAFLEPVAPDRIVATLGAYDIGLHVIAPTTFNYLHALPNKFFEGIMAGLMIVLGPSVEMAHIARTYQLGVVADSFSPEDVARRLRSLSPEEIDSMKRNSLKAAKELNADVEMKKLMLLYDQLLRNCLKRVGNG